MKTALAIDVRLHRSTGIGRTIREVVPRLLDLRPGWEVTLVGCRLEEDWLARARPNGVRTVPWEQRPFRFGEQLGYRRLTHLAPVWWYPHFNVPLVSGARFAVTVHDLIPLLVAPGLRGWLRAKVARLYFHRIRRSAERVFTVSHHVARQLRETIGVPASRLTPVVWGIGPEWSTPRADLQLPDGIEPPFVLYVGNLSPHKNVPALIAALGELAREHPHRLVIAGRREGLLVGDRSLESAAALLPPGRVVFTGAVSEAHLHGLVRAADALVLPSLEEGFGLPPLGAMAAGTPVLVSDTGALVETAGPAALVFRLGVQGDLTRQLRRLLTDEELRGDLRARGRAHAAQFNWDRAAETIARHLDHVLRPRT